MRTTKKNYRNNLYETLDNKADKLMEKIRKMEMEEAFGDMEGYGDNTPNFPKDLEFGHSFEPSPDWEGGTSENIRLKRKKTPLCKNMTTQECLDSILDKISYEGYENLTDEEKDFLKNNRGGGDLVTEGEMCESCGGVMREGECMECGSMYEGIYDKTGKFPKYQEFDYVAEEDEIEFDDSEDDDLSDEDVLRQYCEGDKKDPERCRAHMKMMKEEINEKLHGRQKKLDKNKNGRIDAEDFKLLRKNKKEVTEKWKGDVEVEKTGEYSDMSIEEINSAIKKLKKQNEKFQDEGKKVPQKIEKR